MKIKRTRLTLNFLHQFKCTYFKSIYNTLPLLRYRTVYNHFRFYIYCNFNFRIKIHSISIINLRIRTYSMLNFNILHLTLLINNSLCNHNIIDCMMIHNSRINPSIMLLNYCINIFSQYIYSLLYHSYNQPHHKKV